METNTDIPRDFKRFENQVAGHTQWMLDAAPNRDALGLLQYEDAESSYVLKPVGKPECRKKEHAFYERVKNSSETQDKILQELANLIPQYYGLCRIRVNKKEYDFFKLQDLTYKMQKCNIMDCKIGLRTWDPHATPEKRAVEEEKYVKCKKSLGLCLPGFQMYDPATGELKRYSKDYGKKLDPQGFRETIALFLNSSEVVCRPLVKEILRQLYAIKDWFDRQTYYHFYASSLLIAYDTEAIKQKQTTIGKSHCINGDLKIPNNLIEIKATSGSDKLNGSTTNTPNLDCQYSNITKNGSSGSHNEIQTQDCTNDLSSSVKVRMIDFAHVFEADDGELDRNYLFGLNSLIGILEDLLRQQN